MPDIPNKGRILRLLQYLYLNTDEKHAITTQDLIDAFAETGFKANRKMVLCQDLVQIKMRSSAC